MQIRYASDWIDQISKQDYNCSGQDISTIVKLIKSKSIRRKDFYYAEIRMDEFPQPGLFKYDKNRAKVYQIPEGCEIRSIAKIDNCWVPSYEPITQLTVERDCEVVDVDVGGTELTISTNPSMAVLDDSGMLKKETPVLSNNLLSPMIQGDRVVFKTVHYLGNIRKDTVYDFIVPTTKVFAVNDGVVVYDTASSNGVLSKQANQEVTEHLNSTTRYIGTNGRLMHGTTDLVKLTVFNLSRDPAMK